MKMSEPIAEALYAAADVLVDLGIPYALVGGLAVQAHARPRWSQDVDLVISTHETSLPVVGSRMFAKGFKPIRQAPVRLPGLVVVQFHWPAESLPVDIRVDLMLGEAEFHKYVVERAQLMPLGDRQIRVVSPEDLLLLKLAAARPIDFVDAVDVIRENKSQLDGEYVARWAKDLRLTRELKKAMSEAERVST